METGLSNRSVRRIWRRYRDAIQQGVSPEKVDMKSTVASFSGRKATVDLSAIRDLKPVQRTTFRSLATAIDIPIASLHREFKLGKIKRVSSVIKPLLTPSNKLSRLRHCISQVDKNR